jgi:hypothetical protein
MRTQTIYSSLSAEVCPVGGLWANQNIICAEAAKEIHKLAGATLL